MDDGGGSGAGGFEVKVCADTAKFTNVIVVRFRKCSDLVRESKGCSSQIKPRLGCSERSRVFYRVVV